MNEAGFKVLIYRRSAHEPTSVVAVGNNQPISEFSAEHGVGKRNVTAFNRSADSR